ncbi:hypothetical protein Tco_0853995, partial [Tanacetum coccineum]
VEPVYVQNRVSVNEISSLELSSLQKKGLESRGSIVRQSTISKKKEQLGQLQRLEITNADKTFFDNENNDMEVTSGNGVFEERIADFVHAIRAICDRLEKAQGDVKLYILVDSTLLGDLRILTLFRWSPGNRLCLKFNLQKGGGFLISLCTKNEGDVLESENGSGGSCYRIKCGNDVEKFYRLKRSANGIVLAFMKRLWQTSFASTIMLEFDNVRVAYWRWEISFHLHMTTKRCFPSLVKRVRKAPNEGGKDVYTTSTPKAPTHETSSSFSLKINRYMRHVAAVLFRNQHFNLELELCQCCCQNNTSLSHKCQGIFI